MSSLPIKNLLNQSVFVVPYSYTSNEFGDESFSTPVEYPARIEYQHKMGYGNDGTTYSSIATIYIEHDVHDNSRFFVPAYSDIGVPTSPAGDEELHGNDYDLTHYDVQSRNGTWYQYQTILEHAKPALSINHYYDRVGNFSHCEVTI